MLRSWRLGVAVPPSPRSRPSCEAFEADTGRPCSGRPRRVDGRWVWMWHAPAVVAVARARRYGRERVPMRRDLAAFWPAAVRAGGGLPVVATCRPRAGLQVLAPAPGLGATGPWKPGAGLRIGRAGRDGVAGRGAVRQTGWARRHELGCGPHSGHGRSRAPALRSSSRSPCGLDNPLGSPLHRSRCGDAHVLGAAGRRDGDGRAAPPVRRFPDVKSTSTAGRPPGRGGPLLYWARTWRGP